MKKQKLAILLASAFALIAQSAFAAVTAEEAKQLGGALTEFGAEKAGNKDGSIPAYTGGLSSVAGYDAKTATVYVDPFKDEKPLFSIDAKNMAQYEDSLTPGTKGLLKTHAGFRVDVYPSHRTMRYTPAVIQNTLKNATTAKLGGAVEGDDLQGASAGVPFPIPKTGYEVMWNNNMRFSAAVSHNIGGAYLVDAGGSVTNLPGVNEYFLHPWYDVKGTLRAKTFDSYFGFSALLTSPPPSAGIVFLNYYLPNAAEGGQKVWFYTPGQRRVRAAPEFSYDVPIASYGGVIFWDEVFGFVGRMDRFDFKLVGKKELIVPYNLFNLTNVATVKDSVGPKYINPANVRYEKHRIWVVEAARKATARHAYSRRTFFVDEDCWCLVATDGYDNSGKLWRTSQMNSFPTYNTGGIFLDSWTTYDLVKGNYFTVNTHHAEPGNAIHTYDTAEGLPINLTPQSVAAGGVR